VSDRCDQDIVVTLRPLAAGDKATVPYGDAAESPAVGEAYANALSLNPLLFAAAEKLAILQPESSDGLTS